MSFMERYKSLHCIKMFVLIIIIIIIIIIIEIIINNNKDYYNLYNAYTLVALSALQYCYVYKFWEYYAYTNKLLNSTT